MIMPPSAMVPSIATKPKGLLEHEQRDGDADDAQRRGEQHHEGAREALQLQHQQAEHDARAAIGMPAAIEGWALAFSS